MNARVYRLLADFLSKPGRWSQKLANASITPFVFGEAHLRRVLKTHASYRMRSRLVSHSLSAIWIGALRPEFNSSAN